MLLLLAYAGNGQDLYRTKAGMRKRECAVKSTLRIALLGYLLGVTYRIIV